MLRDEIMQLVPHRPPMLLVDEITVDESGIAHGKYTVRGDEFFLQGHFPGNPVVPGVILCEIMGQSCSLLLGDVIKGKTPYFTGMDKVRFKEKVHPGDVLDITTVVEKSRHNFYFTKGEIHVNGKLCASGHFSFALVAE